MLKNMSLVSICLYVAALHSSMAGMEIFGSLLILIGIVAVAKKQVQFGTAFELPILIFAGLALLNIVATPNLEPWTDRAGELLWIFTYWGLVKNLELLWSERNESLLFKIWLSALTIATLFGVFQFFTGMDPLRSNTDHLVPKGEVFRSTGFFSLCLTFAYSMGISGLSLSLPTSKKNKMLPVFVLSISSIAVLTSMTRGAWIAFGGASSILLFSFRKQLGFKRLLLVGAIFVAAVTAFLSTSGGMDRLNILIHYRSDGATLERWYLWQAYFQMFLDHPFFGVGFHQGSELVLNYYTKLGINHNFVSHAHNDYIQALAETGLVGFLAFIYLLGFALVKTFSLRKTHPEWAYSLFAGQIYILLGSLTQANFTDAEVNHFLIFNWAIASALIVRSQQKMMAK